MEFESNFHLTPKFRDYVTKYLKNTVLLTHKRQPNSFKEFKRWFEYETPNFLLLSTKDTASYFEDKIGYYLALSSFELCQIQYGDMEYLL